MMLAALARLSILVPNFMLRADRVRVAHDPCMALKARDPRRLVTRATGACAITPSTGDS